MSGNTSPCPSSILFVQPVDWEKVEASLQVDETVKEVGWATPGTDAGLRMFEEFVQNRLKHFEAKRNDPNEQALSNLSPWLHFGRIPVYMQQHI